MKAKDLSLKKRIDKEERRLRQNYGDLPDDIASVVDGLIRRAAYMRVQLEDYETDLLDNGYVEPFTQSANMDPYDRERPVARLYSTMNKNYQGIVRQLTDLLPKSPPKAVEGSDNLEEFTREKDAG